jgi:hypothetical protein
MNRLFFCMTLLVCLPVAGQHFRAGRIIHWEEGKTVSSDRKIAPAQNERLMRFQRTLHHDSPAGLPRYHDIIFAHEYYPGHIAVLEDMKFETLDADENEAIRNIGHIPGDIEISQEWVITRGLPVLQISFEPVRRNPLSGSVEKMTSFSYTFQRADSPHKSSGHFKRNYSENSVLSSGTWVMIKTFEDGIYRLTYDDLVQMGIENPSNVRIFGNGNLMLPKMNNEPRTDDLVENRIFVSKGDDGVFNKGDYILFYGQGPVSWNYNGSKGIFEHERHLYSDGSYYFITSDDIGKGRIEPAIVPEAAPGIIVEEFDDYAFHQESIVNLLKSGRNWVGEHFRVVTSRDFRFVFPGIQAGREVRLKWKVSARSPVVSSFRAIHNTTVIDQLDFTPITPGSVLSPVAVEREGLVSFNPTGERIDLSLTFLQNTPSAEGWLNYLTINARRSLSMTGNQMQFRDSESVGSGEVAEFRLRNTTQDTRVWEITDPFDISEITIQRSGNTLVFKNRCDVLRHYIAFDGDYLKPEIAGRISNQNLHGIRSADMIIIAHPLFMTEALRLAAHRRSSDALEVVVVTPRQVYNEFSSGKPDVSALRDFIKMLYDRAVNESEMPRYLLLFGNGSFDNRPGDPSGVNFIPTYQSLNSLVPTQSFVSDDFFGLLDDDEGEYSGLLDIGIGRLPVTTAGQAQALVNKIIGYNSAGNKGDWQNMLCFIGDDGDNNIHMRDADFLAQEVKKNYPAYNIDKIYLDTWQKTGTSLGQRYPDVNRAIAERVRKGALIMNYTGHGNEFRLADENILDINDVMSWNNNDRLPVFMTATCEFSRFDNPERVSAGEMLLLNPTGGGIALFSTTRLVYATPNFLLNQNFYRFILEKRNDENHMRLGDVMRLTKINTGSGINKRNFTLLGDPSMKLAIPGHRVVISSINESAVTEPTDTLKALGKVTVSGQIVNEHGNIMDNFGGLVYHTVFDKKTVAMTLGNDGAVPFKFERRTNIIYKGKASISAGHFSFDFIVPKDIAYHYGNGKISSFASDGENDAAGYFNDFVIGGSDPLAHEDTKGPEIELFINDPDFISGGLTDQNPRLLAFLTDSSGINTMGSGIGHDITLVLNNDPSRLIVLNDYYTADADSYQRGTIEYPFSNLEEGSYRLTLKAWDVFNNSSEATLDFTVSESSGLALRHVFNYPNPFTANTAFHFEHNQPGTGIDVLIQVFTVTGKIVKTINTSINTTGFKPEPVPWDGLDDYGDRIGRGVYIYRIRLRTENGQSAEKYEKLVILK